jgi:hypothetical protein
MVSLPFWIIQSICNFQNGLTFRNLESQDYLKIQIEFVNSNHSELLTDHSSPALRIFPPNNLIPKHTPKGTDQALKYLDREIRFPGNTRVLILFASTHRNPNYYKHGPSSYSPDKTDMDEFKPERWILNSIEEAQNLGGNAVEMASYSPTAPKQYFFKPQRGAFIPWSIGHRECIGKKFAHTELLVALAVILHKWSVELVVPEKDGYVDRIAWEKARASAKGHLKTGMKHYTTMQLKKGLIPLKIVMRGQESSYST